MNNARAFRCSVLALRGKGGPLDPAKKTMRKEMEKAVLGSGFGNKKAIFVAVPNSSVSQGMG